MLRLLGEDKVQKPAASSRLPEQHWTPTRLAINLLLKKPTLGESTGTHNELADSGIKGVDLLLRILDFIHDEPGISTQNLLARFSGDDHEPHLYKLAAMEPPVENDESLERMFADCLQSLQKQYIHQRQKQLINKLQSGEVLSEAEKQEHRKIFTNKN
jgi:DNA primase